MDRQGPGVVLNLQLANVLLLSAVFCTGLTDAVGPDVTGTGLGLSVVTCAVLACTLAVMAAFVALRDPQGAAIARRILAAEPYHADSKEGFTVSFAGRVAPLGSVEVSGLAVASLAELTFEFEEGSSPNTERWRHQRAGLELIATEGVLRLERTPEVWGSSERVRANVGDPSRENRTRLAYTDVIATGARAVAVGVLRRTPALSLSSHVNEGWEPAIWATAPGRDPRAELRHYLARRSWLVAALVFLSCVMVFAAALHPWPRMYVPPTSEQSDD